MPDYGLWTQDTRWYEQLRAIIDMKNSNPWSQGLSFMIITLLVHSNKWIHKSSWI